MQASAITTPASFNKTAFDQALAAWQKTVADDQEVGASHEPYRQAFSTFTVGQNVSLEKVKELKKAWSGDSSDVVGQAAYRYAALAYLSGGSAPPSPVDFTALKERLAEEQSQVRNAYEKKKSIIFTKQSEKSRISKIIMENIGKVISPYSGRSSGGDSLSELEHQLKGLQGELNGLRHQMMIARHKQTFITGIAGTPYDLNH
jgi:vacuolar-type H+-ATPase subunit I/STV1